MRFSRPHLATSRGTPEESGLTLIEVIVALTILLIALIPLSNLLGGGVKVAAGDTEQITADYLATQAVEEVSGMAASQGTTFWTGLSSSGLGSTTSTESVPTSTTTTNLYTLTTTLEWVGQGQDSSECSSTSGSTTPTQLLQVRASVTWADMGAIDPSTSVTDLAPPGGTYATGTGAIGVQVVNAAGADLAGVTVSLSGSSGNSAVTGSDGCVFFPYLATSGTYTVTATEAGYVSNQEVTSPAISNITVSSEATTEDSLTLDEAGTLTLTPALAAGTANAAGGLTYSVDNPGLSSYSLYSFGVPSVEAAAAAAPSTASLNPLFPYPSGYVPFAGSCTDSDPNGESTSGTPFYTSAPTSAYVPGGGTASATVGLGTVGLSVESAAGAAVSGATATATPLTTANKPGDWSSSILTWVCPTVATYQLTTSSTTGSSITGLPYGHYAVTIRSGALLSTVYVWVALPWKTSSGTPEPAGTYIMSSTTGAVTTPATSPIVVTSL